MSVPNQSGKISGEKLSQIKHIDWDGSLSALGDEPVALSEKFSNFRFDYLWRPSLENKSRLFVLFSGDAQRDRNNPPVFQRWTWTPYFPGHCLFVSDPSLFLDKSLGLAWYCGTSHFDPMPRIIDTVRRIASNLGVDNKNIFAYGSSGGGFASLRMAALFPDICAVVVNPQINITQYEFKVERYLRSCFDGRNREEAIKDFPRLNILEYGDVLRERRIIYCQNILDVHHYEFHFKPFCLAMHSDPTENISEGPFRKILFAHEGGHPKAETPAVFDTAMNIINTDALFS
jgi:hypothetical protein